MWFPTVVERLFKKGSINKGHPRCLHVAFNENKTDISYLKISWMIFYINHPTKGCAQQQVSLS